MIDSHFTEFTGFVLLCIWAGEDLSEDASGTLLRSIKVSGTGYITANEGSLVKGMC